MTQYAYLHGFASSAFSSKGQKIATAFRERGLEFHLPDLNRPSFEALTVTAMLAEIDRMASAHPGERWCLIGSSMGGWLTSLWSRENPDLVERVVLLCPGFCLLERWPELLGQEGYASWRERGVFDFPDGAGVVRPMHYAFIEDASTYDPMPEPVTDVLLIHGRQDETVPIQTSRDWAALHPERVAMVEVEDGHRLSASVDEITARAMAFFGLP
jgi:hypothetical protein